MQKNKILLIATTPFIRDGLTKIELDVLYYNKADCDFTIASRFGYDTEIGKKLLNDADFHCLTLPSKKHLIRYQKAIESIVKRGNFDAVYIHGNSSMMYFEAKPAKKAGAKKVVTHCHNTKSNLPLLDKAIKKKFNANVDVKIACSQYVADFAYDGNRVELILNGPDLKKFEFDSETRKQIRQNLNLTDETILMGHVGRLIGQKNHKKLIEIFDEFHKRNPESHLLLIGEGELKEAIEKQIKDLGLSDHVTLIGNTDHVSDYYHAMDLMVMPSLHEGLCLVALETQANGMPVFLSDTVSPESFATALAHKISLEESAGQWAEKIKMTDLQRQDCGLELTEKGMTWDEMMKKIRKVLV